MLWVGLPAGNAAIGKTAKTETGRRLPALSWTAGTIKCDLQQTIYAAELIQPQLQQLVHQVQLMLKPLTRFTILEASNDACKRLQPSLHRTDALAQRLAGYFSVRAISALLP